ncbi:TfuA-like protein [Streptomyces sp. NBC_00441]|uniref:TfuA-like protein n=1 Tax=Streptomyces sp. NBC_00441 TaxID=2975742 RepID=UPI002E2B019A|nr:TfuA-like protein [Streptomyces sp. NBC_00441]
MLHIYVGPTLSASDLAQLAPGAVVHPPVKHGDFFDDRIGDGDTVLILDGLYHHSNALRHKEILHLIANGVRVVGASSIGALRAAELHEFGMVGIGEVFNAYRRGQIVGDDEVAVAHLPDGDWTTNSLPLVNLRAMLTQAASESVISPAQVVSIWEIGRSVYYPQRSARLLITLTARAGHHAFSAWLESRLSADIDFCNRKRADALDALDFVLRNQNQGNQHPAPYITDGWVTPDYRSWRNHFHVERRQGAPLRSLDRLWYQQIFNPDFSSIWRQFLEEWSWNPADGSPGMPLSGRIQSHYANSIAPDVDTIILTMILFRPRLRIYDTKTRSSLLCSETVEHRLTIKQYLSAADHVQARNPTLDTSCIRPELAEKILSEIWNVPSETVGQAAQLRGFLDMKDAAKGLSRFIIGYLNQSNRG